MNQQKPPFQSYYFYETDIIEPTESQNPRVREDTQDNLVSWQLEREVQILFLIFLAGIIIIIGLLNRKVENVLLFALFLSGIIIFVILGILK